MLGIFAMSDAMSEVDVQAIETLGAWLKSLGSDTNSIASVVADESVAEAVRRPLAGSLNYLFKSLDLIDDGIEGLGFMDDAFVIRIAVSNAQAAGSLPESLVPLATDAQLIREVLGDLSTRLDGFVRSLESGVVRGRSVDDIVGDASIREEFVGEVVGWTSRFSPPAFVMDEQGLVKLRSFLAAKLP